MITLSTNIIYHVYDILRRRVPRFPDGYNLTQNEVFNILTSYKKQINSGANPPTSKDNILKLAEKIGRELNYNVQTPKYNGMLVVIMALAQDITPQDGSAYKWVYEAQSAGGSFTIPTWIKYSSVIFVSAYLLRQLQAFR